MFREVPHKNLENNELEKPLTSENQDTRKIMDWLNEAFAPEIQDHGKTVDEGDKGKRTEQTVEPIDMDIDSETEMLERVCNTF